MTEPLSEAELDELARLEDADCLDLRKWSRPDVYADYTPFLPHLIALAREALAARKKEAAENAATNESILAMSGVAARKEKEDAALRRTEPVGETPVVAPRVERLQSETVASPLTESVDWDDTATPTEREMDRRKRAMQDILDEQAARPRLSPAPPTDDVAGLCERLRRKQPCVCGSYAVAGCPLCKTRLEAAATLQSLGREVGLCEAETERYKGELIVELQENTALRAKLEKAREELKFAMDFMMAHGHHTDKCWDRKRRDKCICGFEEKADRLCHATLTEIGE